MATHTGEFSGDKASLLMWSSAAAYRVSTSTGQVVWQSPEGPHGLAVRRAVMSADGSYVAVLHALAPDTRNYSSAAFPVQLAVAVYRGNELILAVDLPRDDDQVAKEPPGDPLQITLADDAKYLTVATTRTLRLYRLF